MSDDERREYLARVARVAEAWLRDPKLRAWDFGKLPVNFIMDLAEECVRVLDEHDRERARDKERGT